MQNLLNSNLLQIAKQLYDAKTANEVYDIIADSIGFAFIRNEYNFELKLNVLNLSFYLPDSGDEITFESYLIDFITFNLIDTHNKDILNAQVQIQVLLDSKKTEDAYKLAIDTITNNEKDITAEILLEEKSNIIEALQNYYK